MSTTPELKIDPDLTESEWRDVMQGVFVQDERIAIEIIERVDSDTIIRIKDFIGGILRGTRHLTAGSEKVMLSRVLPMHFKKINHGQYRVE